MKKSKNVEYPKNYAPISHVKPKGKIARTIYELIQGKKAYIPRNNEEKRAQESLTKEKIKLRKKQAELIAMGIKIKRSK